MNDLLMTFYGDDFTGSTDAMECLEINGIPAVLFLDAPTPEQLSRFPDVRGVGVAGVSRTMSVQQMDRELIPKFSALRDLGAPFVHYKVCSTFDSSPTVGSIGHAIDIGWDIFQPPMVPMMIGAPFLRRYVAFGNLFARVGDVTYRLDRHPTMSKHPITPMRESDLRLHLAEQTDKRIALIDLWHMDTMSDAELDAYLAHLLSGGAQVIMFDTTHTDHMMTIGRMVWNQHGEKPVFLVGSSGFEYSLGMYLRSTGVIEQPPPLPSPGVADQLLVMSGSCAPATAEQIRFVLDRGFQSIRLDSPALVDPVTQGEARASAVQAALDRLAAGENVAMYTALGPDDLAIHRTNERMIACGLDPKTVGHQLGSQQGLILRAIVEQHDLHRFCVCGGDTCGHALKQLGIYALRMIIPVAPGAPLCRAYSDNAQFDRLEISLKGGQNGAQDYLARIYYGLQPHEPLPERA
jgi:3-oxoisoapionate kinase